jgi:hypothetical protein
MSVPIRTLCENEMNRGEGETQGKVGAGPAAALEALLLRRLAQAREELDRAQLQERWSQLPGHAGIAEGLAGSLALLRSTGQDGTRICSTLVVRLQERVRLHTACRDEALLARRFADVPGADGRATGYLMALKHACEELEVPFPEGVR